jgi:hypothetical protein
MQQPLTPFVYPDTLPIFYTSTAATPAAARSGVPLYVPWSATRFVRSRLASPVNATSWLWPGIIEPCPLQPSM